jgi:hypothetical protein
VTFDEGVFLGVSSCEVEEFEPGGVGRSFEIFDAKWAMGQSEMVG